MRMNVLRNQLCNLVDLRDFGFGGGLIIRECWKQKYFLRVLNFCTSFHHAVHFKLTADVFVVCDGTHISF